jgi:hypothetical protein
MTTQEQRDEYKRNKEFKKTIEDRLIYLTEFCDRMDIPYTINRNPSLEEIENIKSSIIRSKEIINKINKYI